MTAQKIDVLAVMDAAAEWRNDNEQDIREARAAVAELFRLVAEIDDECGNSKPDFSRVVRLASEAAALARIGGAK